MLFKSLNEGIFYNSKSSIDRITKGNYDKKKSKGGYHEVMQ